MNLPSNRCGCG